MGDPAGLRDQVDALFMQWAQLSEEQPAEKQHNGFVAQLQQAGFLKVWICLLRHWYSPAVLLLLLSFGRINAVIQYQKRTYRGGGSGGFVSLFAVH